MKKTLPLQLAQTSPENRYLADIFKNAKTKKAECACLRESLVIFLAPYPAWSQDKLLFT